MQPKFYKIKEKSKNKKENYTIIVASNKGNGKIKQHSISSKAFAFWTYFMIILLVIIVTYGVYTVLVIGDGQGAIFSLRTQVEKLTNQNSELLEENVELNEKVTLLSNTLNIKIIAEEEAKAIEEALYVPSGVPLITDASMKPGTEDGIGGTEVPVVLFTTKSETNVLAAGQGTVTFAGTDAQYGKQVMIDHGNGYISVYKCNGEMMVKEDEVVNRDTVLFEVESDIVIHFQIIKDDLFIDPTEIMEIYG
jgi:cell division protein FtsB